jgi:hypothetical protein
MREVCILRGTLRATRRAEIWHVVARACKLQECILLYSKQQHKRVVSTVKDKSRGCCTWKVHIKAI